MERHGCFEVAVSSPSMRQLQSVLLPESEVIVVKREAPMILKVKEKPLRHRMDAEFWAPHWHENVYKVLWECPYPLAALGKFIVYARRGLARRLVHVSREKTKDCVRYIQCAHIWRTGICEPLLGYVRGVKDKWRYCVREGDIVVSRVGWTMAGRCALVHRDLTDVVVSGNNVKIKVHTLKPAFVVTFLQCRYGIWQLQRYAAGVAAVAIDSHDIKSVLLPIIPPDMQQCIDAQHKLIGEHHHAAMRAMSEGMMDEMRLHLQIAEGMLQALITQLEQVIRGERHSIAPLLPDNLSDEQRSALLHSYRSIGAMVRRAYAKWQGGMRKIYGMYIFDGEVHAAVCQLLERIDSKLC